jgi:hypothetical protein
LKAEKGRKKLIDVLISGNKQTGQKDASEARKENPGESRDYHVRDAAASGEILVKINSWDFLSLKRVLFQDSTYSAQHHIRTTWPNESEP